jgi:hypothetical protein
MSELLPTLRESLRETARRRSARRRPPLVPALVAVAGVAVVLTFVTQRDGTQPADEVPATPMPTVTFTPVPTVSPPPSLGGTSRSMPKLDRGKLRATPVAPDDPGLSEALSGLNDSHKVVRAWKVRGLQGHVLLTRKGDQWCLSAPDPLTDYPDAERGVGCAADRWFQRRGASIGLTPADGRNGITITVKPDLKTIRIRQR